MNLLDAVDLCVNVASKIPDQISFMCFLGTLVDGWCAVQNMPEAEQKNMILMLNDVRNDVLKALGPMEV